jgi:hypothetical protein
MNTGNVTTLEGGVIPFELKLRSSVEGSLMEASRFNQQRGDVHKTLYRIAERLKRLDIPYSVAGGMALNAHGFQRPTTDVDIVVTRPDLDRIHDALDGLGFVRPFSASKNLRDAETGVKIEFLITGEYPGDGKPKEVAFPHPDQVAQEIDGIKYLNLTSLITLKLASGMTGSGRLKDLADVEQLILLLGLKEDFADRLPSYVQPTYRSLYRPLESAERFIQLESNFDTQAVESLVRRGVERTESGHLLTSDREMAREFGFWPEGEVDPRKL